MDDFQKALASPVLGQDQDFSLSEETLNALYAMAHTLYGNGKYQEAKQCFHFLTILNANERKFWMGLAACYQMLKDYSSAIQFYSLAAVQDATDPYVHVHAADCYYALGEKDQALQALDSAQCAAAVSEKHNQLIPQLELIRQVWLKKK